MKLIEISAVRKDILLLMPSADLGHMYQDFNFENVQKRRHSRQKDKNRIEYIRVLYAVFTDASIPACIGWLYCGRQIKYVQEGVMHSKWVGTFQESLCCTFAWRLGDWILYPPKESTLSISHIGCEVWHCSLYMGYPKNSFVIPHIMNIKDVNSIIFRVLKDHQRLVT